MIHVRKINDEVFYAESPFVKVGTEEIEFLRELAGKTKHKRIRLCAHRDVQDNLHEMLILLVKETYIRPAKHIGKAESLHVIEGYADAVFFDVEGRITEVIQMGDYSSGKVFYYRIADSFYHTLLIRSPCFVFHEATMGPFRKPETVLAPWTPIESDTAAVKEYLESLDESVMKYLDDERPNGNRANIKKQ